MTRVPRHLRFAGFTKGDTLETAVPDRRFFSQQMCDIVRLSGRLVGVYVVFALECFVQVVFPLLSQADWLPESQQWRAFDLPPHGMRS